MKPSKCLSTPARLLHKALLLEFANTTHKSHSIFTSSSTRSIHKSLAIPTSRPTDTCACAHALRAITASTKAPRCHARSFTTSPAPRAVWKSKPKTPALKVTVKKHPRDEDIPADWVRIVDAEGNLSESQRLRDVLARLPKNHSLDMVGPPPEPPAPIPGVWRPPPAAICRLVDVVAEKAMLEAAEREAKRLAQQTKTLELGWSIAAHDLGHRMKRFHEFLGKGLRVEIMLARKRGSRKVDENEARQLVDRIRETASEIPGVQEYKKMTGVLCGVVTMFFQGKKPKTGKYAKKSGAEDEGREAEEEEEREEEEVENDDGKGEGEGEDRRYV